MTRGPKVGQPSNNPHGRPPKERSLTEQIKKALDLRCEGDAQQRTRKEVMGEMLAQAVSTARATFPDGTVMKLSVKDWLETTFKVLAQVDGPPRTDINMSVDGNQTVKGYVTFSPDDWDSSPGAQDGPGQPE